MIKEKNNMNKKRIIALTMLVVTFASTSYTTREKEIFVPFVETTTEVSEDC